MIGIRGSVLVKMVREARHVRVVGFDSSSVKRVVERSFENSLYNKTLHVARVPSALLTQGLNECLMCVKS